MEKICENCKYFYQHYGWSNDRFKKVWIGHCLLKYRSKKFVQPCATGCDNWCMGKSEQEKTERITDTLNYMARCIRDIRDYLDNELTKK